MTEKLSAPQLELREGFHGTLSETRFVRNIVDQIRSKGIFDPITVIGSRAQGGWISKKSYAEMTKRGKTFIEFPSFKDVLYSKLDLLAKAKKFSRKDIPKLADLLSQKTTPQDIFDLLEGKYGNPGSDFDLLLHVQKLPSGISAVYIDESGKTGQTVDLFSLNG